MAANAIKQYTTASSGTVTATNTGQDVIIVHDSLALTVSLTIAFPASPLDGQKLTICSSVGITTLTLTSGSSILGALTSLAVGGFGTWVYNTDAGKWFRCG